MKGENQMFQSLGRDSVFSDGNGVRLPLPIVLVSIPRSGFCVFGLARTSGIISLTPSFQSLGRDSVFSD